MGEDTSISYMDEALQLAAQCWCDPKTEDRVMDVALAKAVAKRIAPWMKTAEEAERERDEARQAWREMQSALEQSRDEVERLREYAGLLERGLSVYEARGTIWPDGPALAEQALAGQDK